MSAIQKKHGYKLEASVKHSGHYYHSRCTDIDVTTEEYEYAADDVQEEISELLRDFMEWIYKQLEKQYEYETSEEAIKETIEANEWTFEADGTLNNGTRGEITNGKAA